MYSATPPSQPQPKQPRQQPSSYQSQQPPAYNYQGYGQMGQMGSMVGSGMTTMDGRSMQPHQQNMGPMMSRQMGQPQSGPTQMTSHSMAMDNISMSGQMQQIDSRMGSQQQINTNQRQIDNRMTGQPSMESHNMGQLGNNQMNSMNSSIGNSVNSSMNISINGSMNSSINSSMNNLMNDSLGAMNGMVGDRSMGVQQHPLNHQVGQHQQPLPTSNPGSNQQLQRMMNPPAYSQQEKQRMEQYQRQQQQQQMQSYQSHMQHVQAPAPVPIPVSVPVPIQTPHKPPAKNNSRRKRTVNKANLDEPVPPQNYHFQPPPSYSYQQNNNMMSGHQMSGHPIAGGQQQLQHHSMMHGAPGTSQVQYPNTKSSEMVRLELRNSIQAKQQQQKQQQKDQPSIEQHRISSGLQTQMQRNMQQEPSMIMGGHMGQYQYSQLGQSQQSHYHQSSSMINNLGASMGQAPHPQQMQEMINFNTPQGQVHLNQNTPISSVASTSSASSLDFPNELGFFDMQDPELPISCDKLEENLKSLTVHDFAILGRCAFDFSNQQTIDFVRQILLM